MKREEELKNVSGGMETSPEASIACSNCKNVYTDHTASAYRDVEDGCMDVREYKCPHCGTWNRE